MKIRVVIEEVVVDIETPDATYTSTCRDWLKDAVNQAAEKAIELHNARNKKGEANASV